jgi:hypothetical protein
MKVLCMTDAADSVGLVNVELMDQLEAIAVPKAKGTVPFRWIADCTDDSSRARSLISLFDERDYGGSVSE